MVQWLQALGQVTNGPLSTVLLSRGLEQELLAVVESSVIGKAALISLHAHIEHLRSVLASCELTGIVRGDGRRWTTRMKRRICRSKCSWAINDESR
jgi:hypothetical protein